MKSAFSLTRLSLGFVRNNVRYLILQLLTLAFVSFSLLLSGAVVQAISGSVDSFASEISEGTDIVIISPAPGVIGEEELNELSDMDELKTLVPVWWSTASIDKQKTLMIASTQLGESLPGRELGEIDPSSLLIEGPSAPGLGQEDRRVSVDGVSFSVDSSRIQRLSDESDRFQRVNGGNFIVPQEGLLLDTGLTAAPKVIFVALSDSSKITAAIDDVKNLLPANTTVVTTAEYARFLAGNTELVVLVANMFGLAMLITGISVIAVISALALDNRRYEYSLLRLIGTSKRKLISWNLIESVLLVIPCVVVSISITALVFPKLIGSLPDALFGELPIRPTQDLNVAVIGTLSLISSLLVVGTRLLVLSNFMRRVDIGIVYLRNITANRVPARRYVGLAGAAILVVLLGLVRPTGSGLYGPLALAVLLGAPALLMLFAVFLRSIFTGIRGTVGGAGYIASSMLRGCVPLVLVAAVALNIPSAAHTSAGNLVTRGNQLVDTLQIPSYYLQTSDADALPLKPLLTSEDLADVEKIPGVEKAVPGVLTNISVNGGQFTIQGISAGTSMPAAANAGQKSLENLMNTRNGVILNRKAAETLGISEGDRLKLPLAGFEKSEVVAIDDYISVNDGQIVVNAEDLCSSRIECNYSYFEIHTTGEEVQSHLEDLVSAKNGDGGQEYWLNTAEDEYLALSKSIASTAYLAFVLSLNLFLSCFVAIYILYRSSLNKVLPILSQLRRIGYPSGGITKTALLLVTFVSIVSSLIASALYVLFVRSLSSLLARDLAISGVHGATSVTTVLSYWFGSLIILLLWGAVAAKRSQKRIQD